MPFLLLFMIPFMSYAQSQGPLTQVPIAQFSCYSRIVEGKFHFYYTPENSPWASRDEGFVCHDIGTYGERDSDLFPRLETVPGTFGLWNGFDLLFYDNDRNGNLDINDLIQAKMYPNGGPNVPFVNPFFLFTAPGKDELYQAAGARKSLWAYYLRPTFRTTENKSYCPKQEHYNSNDLFLKALGEVIGVDTEGLYQGINSRKYDDIILLRETDIKQVWFYVNQKGEAKEPTDDVISSRTIYFYYPLNKAEPLVKHANQELYRVVAPDRELYPTHDRKIACIPKY